MSSGYLLAIVMIDIYSNQGMVCISCISWFWSFVKEQSMKYCGITPKKFFSSLKELWFQNGYRQHDHDDSVNCTSAYSPGDSILQFLPENFWDSTSRLRCVDTDYTGRKTTLFTIRRDKIGPKQSA
jgi:hypothetical protein